MAKLVLFYWSINSFEVLLDVEVFQLADAVVDLVVVGVGPAPDGLLTAAPGTVSLFTVK